MPSADSEAPGANDSLDAGYARSRQRWFSWHWETWLTTAAVSWVMWDLQTDNYPAMENARPDWYIYGWPICFATSGRGRFNFYLGFKTGFMILDVLIAVMLVACTPFAVETLVRQLKNHKRFNAIDYIGIVVGICLAALVVSDEFGRLLTLLFGSVAPLPEYSPIPGDLRLVSRMDVFKLTPLAIGVAAVGYTMVKLALRPIDHFVPPGDERPGLRSTWTRVDETNPLTSSRRTP